MLGAAIRDWVTYNEGKKLFDACNFKGTFANCKSVCCIGCHKNRDDGFLQHIKGQVFEVSDSDSQVVYPKPVGKNLSWVRRKLGTLFGTCCPACSSKNFKVNFMLRHGCNKCGDCGHMWGNSTHRHDQ